MLEPFHSSRLLVERALEHLHQFEHVERGFIAKNPYSRIMEVDPQSGDEIYKIKVSQTLPAKLAVISFDIINCLRSALDHVVFDAAREIGGEPKPKYTKFPFGRTLGEAATDINRYKDSEVPQALRPFLLTYQPYCGGKHSLWELNQIRNEKIHQTLRAVAIEGGGVAFTDFGKGGFGGGEGESMSSLNTWDDNESTLTYLRKSPGFQIDANADAVIFIALTDASTDS